MPSKTKLKGNVLPGSLRKSPHLSFIAWLAALIAALTVCTSSSGSPYTEAAARLDGIWHGENFELRIDAERAQASIDPNRPFHWQRFLIKQITDAEIVFTIGAELYTAIIAADELVLTGTSFRGQRVLARKPRQQLK